jgi:hypothetical protein
MDKKLLKQYKSTFHFGVSVSYDKVLKRGYGLQVGGSLYNREVEKTWKQRLVTMRTGVVVGWKWLSNGIAVFDQDDGNYYSATQSVFAIEIKRGMLNKVDLVLPESLSLRFKPDSYANDQVKRIYEEFPDRITTWSDKDKGSLRDQMKNVPRDSKGRWI